MKRIVLVSIPLANNTWEFYTNYVDFPYMDSIVEIDSDGNIIGL